MEKIKSWHAWAFILIFITIAEAVNMGADYLRAVASPTPSVPNASSPLTEPARPTPQVITETLEQAEERRRREKTIAQRRVAEESAEKHTYDIARYVNPGFERKSSNPTVAIAVVREDGSFDSGVGDAIARQLGSDRFTIASGLFTPQFVSDGLFTSAFSGSRTVYSGLELSNAVDMLLLGRETVNYSTENSLQRITTADLRVDLSTAPAHWSGQSRAWSYSAKGAGFNQADARSLALERILKQIESDTNNFSERWYTNRY